MKRILLTSASALVLMSAPAAMAQNSMDAETNAEVNAQVEAEQTENQVERTLDSAGDSIEQGYENTKETVSEIAQDVENSIVTESDEERGARSQAEVTADADAEVQDDADVNATAEADVNTDDNSGMTVQSQNNVDINDYDMASNIIGSDIYNDDNELIGEIEDITIDAEGNTQMIVVGDGSFFGAGDKIAVNYGDIMVDTANENRLTTAMVQDDINDTNMFSYDSLTGYRVSTLLDGQLVDSNSKTVGQIDDMTFTNGQADKIIVSYNQILGLGGDKAVMNYDLPQLVVNSEENVDFQINDNQVSALKELGRNTANN